MLCDTFYFYQERHLLVKVIDRILYKLDDLVRPFVHKVNFFCILIFNSRRRDCIESNPIFPTLCFLKIIQILSYRWDQTWCLILVCFIPFSMDTYTCFQDLSFLKFTLRCRSLLLLSRCWLMKITMPGWKDVKLFPTWPRFVKCLFSSCMILRLLKHQPTIIQCSHLNESSLSCYKLVSK